jgi:hypothetical protein
MRYISPELIQHISYSLSATSKKGNTTGDNIIAENEFHRIIILLEVREPDMADLGV